ncbi:hypothetical protein AV641_09515 [Pseudomonas fragi]|nr:hypothetical protein AV641_09515 [Pseudomonas fragi]
MKPHRRQAGSHNDCAASDLVAASCLALKPYRRQTGSHNDSAVSDLVAASCLALKPIAGKPAPTMTVLLLTLWQLAVWL